MDEVRNHLRGDPGTDVSITFVREGVKGVNGNYEPQTITMKRTIVQIPDVKYFGFVGDPKDGIGYIDLSGFASNAGREVRFAIRALQHGAEAAAMSEDERAGASMANIADPTKLKVSVYHLSTQECVFWNNCRLLPSSSSYFACEISNHTSPTYHCHS